MEPNRLLNTSAADLAAYLVAKYQIQPVTLHRDKSSADQEECKIDVSRDPNRIFLEDRTGPYYIPGQRIRVEVPFDGDGELFYCRANTFSSSAPRGSIENGALVLSWETPHDATRDLRPEIDQALQSIEQYLNWVRTDVDQFNRSLGGDASAAVEARRKRLLDNQGRLANLGIPVKARSGAPATYVLPSVRRKVVPRLPPAGSVPYAPEPVLDDQLYEHILSVVQNMAHVMERSPSAFAEMDEESLRQHFLVQLNGQFEGQATAETFNAAGKTDILLRAGDRNVFIAECKFWKGPKQFGEAINQLLSYTAWRDTKTAIFVSIGGQARQPYSVAFGWRRRGIPTTSEP